MALKVPPHNLEAEQSILGSLLLEREAWDNVSDIIFSSDFYSPAHQIIYNAIGELHVKNSIVDVITVSNSIKSRGEFESIGGSEYLVELLNKTVSTVNVGSYAKIVKDKALLRRMILTSQEIIELAYKEEFKDIENFVDHAESEFFKLGENKKAEGLMSPLEIVKNSVIKIEELYNRKSDVTGIPTGFTQLDKMTSGLQGGELIIIAARPSMGKTAFSLNMAQHMALKEKKTVAYFSLEMSREGLMMRLLASESRINMSDVRNGRIPDTAWAQLIQAASVISESKLYIDETPSISPYEVRSRARKLNAQVGLDVIIIDYLQMMDLKQKVESRERAVSEISKALKGLAKELKIPVIALAQLNRGVEGRSDKKPMLSDLRESGSIEQDADVIMMLYRDDYYDKEDSDKQGQAEIIIGKQRNGPTGTVKLKWDAAYGRFKDAEFAPQHPLPPPPQSPPHQFKPKPKNFAPGAEV